jgi:hypothetical protein
LSTAETTTAEEKKRLRLASPGYLHKDESKEMKLTNRRLKPMACTAGSTRIRKLKNNFFALLRPRRRAQGMRPNRDTRVLASTSGMQIAEDQHLRGLEPKQEK